MKRMLLPLLAASLMLTGCLDLGMKVKIGKDWSGDVSLRMEMLDQMFQMLTSPQMGQQMGVDLSLINEEKLRALVAEHGGQVRKFENKVENGIRTIDVLASVPNVRKFLDQTGGGQVGIVKEGDLWVWNLLDNESTQTFTNMDDELLEQQLNMLAPSLAGLRMNLEITVPQLVETNLKKSGNTASFSLDFDQDIAGKKGRTAVEAFKSLLQPKKVKFKGPKE